MHKVTRLLIRTDGTEQVLPDPVSNVEIERLIGAECLDTVALHHMGHPLHVMLVDDAGWETMTVETEHGITLVPVRARKPVNHHATRLYRLNRAGPSDHLIVGDVVICPDEDFA